MSFASYIFRCVFMLLVTWAGIRGIGKKSIAEMTAYDLAAIMVLTTVASEPLVYKTASKATIGVVTIAITTALIGLLSLKKFFYNLDAKPVIVISEGKILENELKKVRMNVPLLISELRVKGYYSLSDVAYAIVEPNGKLSVLSQSDTRPVQPKDLAITPSPASVGIPLVIDGAISKSNLDYIGKDETWLKQQLQMFKVNSIEQVLIVEWSNGSLYVNKKNEKFGFPDLF